MCAIAEILAIKPAIFLKRIGPDNFIDLMAKGSFKIDGGPVSEEDAHQTNSDIFLKEIGRSRTLELAESNSFDIIIEDPTLVIKNLTNTIAIIPDDFTANGLEKRRSKRNNQ